MGFCHFHKDEQQENPELKCQSSCPWLLDEHTALQFLIQLSTVHANNVIRTPGHTLLSPGESADSGPAFGITSTGVLSAECVACAKLKEHFWGCQVRLVLLLHDGKNKNRTWYWERVFITPWKWEVHLPFESKITAGQFLWDTATLGQRQEQTELSKLIRTKAKQFLHWWGTFWASKVNAMFFPFLSQFIPIPRASWRMDGSGSSCCGFQNCCLMRFLQSSDANREYSGAALRLGIREELNVPESWVGGQCFPHCWACQVQCVEHHPVRALSFPSDLTVAAFPLSTDSVPWKSTNGKKGSIFKGILDKMANYAEKAFETCTSCYVFCTGMFWQMDAFKQRNEGNEPNKGFLIIFVSNISNIWMTKSKSMFLCLGGN